MRTKALFLAAMIGTIPIAAAADGYGSYGYGYRYDRYCSDHYGTIYSDYRRLQRDHDKLQRRLVEQNRTCAQAAQQQQTAYQQIINQQRGLTAELTEQQAVTSDMVETLADAKGVPEELLDRPSRAEFDALQERYDTLLAAYRNLERDYRAATDGN